MSLGTLKGSKLNNQTIDNDGQLKESMQKSVADSMIPSSAVNTTQTTSTTQTMPIQSDRGRSQSPVYTNKSGQNGKKSSFTPINVDKNRNNNVNQKDTSLEQINSNLRSEIESLKIKSSSLLEAARNSEKEYLELAERFNALLKEKEEAELSKSIDIYAAFRKSLEKLDEKSDRSNCANLYIVAGVISILESRKEENIKLLLKTVADLDVT